MIKRILIWCVTLALLVSMMSVFTVSVTAEAAMGHVDFRSGSMETEGVSAAVNVVGVTEGLNPISYYANDYDPDSSASEFVAGRGVSDAVKINASSVTGGANTSVNVYVKYYFNSTKVYVGNHGFVWLAVDSGNSAMANIATSQYIRANNAGAGSGWPAKWVGHMVHDAWTWQKFTLNTTGNVTIGAGDNVGLFALQQIYVCKTSDAAAAEALIEADVQADENKNKLDSMDETNITLYGRTSFNDDGNLVLFWTNSGFSFGFNGTGATASFSVNNIANGAQAYLCVYIDGEFAPSKTIRITESPMRDVVLAENLPAGEHTIEVRKRNEANYAGSATVTVGDLKVTDGEFTAPPAAPTRVIEFVGDSITSGFGSIGSGGFSTNTQDGTLTYAVLAAKALGANASVLSRSGIGYAKSAGNSSSNMIQHYTHVATLPGDTVCGDEWNFETHKSDVVVITLGTNDGGTDASTEFLYDKAIEMLTLVRAKNPDATIVWLHGLMGIGRAVACIESAIHDFGDDKVYSFRVAAMAPSTEGVGADGHPTAQTHINRSILVAEFIAEKMGWEVDGSVMLQAQMQWAQMQAAEDSLSNYSALSVKRLENAIQRGRDMVAAGGYDTEEYVAAAKAVWQAYNDLATDEESSSEYVVIDSFDTIDGAWFGDGTGTLDRSDFIEGKGCASSAGMEYTITINRHGAYNVPLPEDRSDWYIECWIYVDDVTKITDKCYFSVIQDSESTGQQWNLQSLNLSNGWNKLRLSLADSSPSFTTIKGVYLSFRPMVEPITIKLDYVVLARGKFAGDITAWENAMEEAAAMLAEKENATLRAAYEHAQTVITQADLDAATARLIAAMEPTAFGDVNGDDKVDSTDARMTLQYFVGSLGESDLDLEAADVSGDGNVDSTDARLILQKFVGSIENFPAEEDNSVETVKKEYSVLFIGNSYTYYNNMPIAQFPVIAMAVDCTADVTAITCGGYTLEQFANPADTYGAQVDAALTGEKKYDFVVLQEFSTRPAANSAAFYKAVRNLVGRIRETGAKPILYATWGRHKDSSTLTDYGWTHESMTWKLAAAYQAIGEELDVPVVNVGLAFMDVTANPDFSYDLYNADLTHPSYTGSWLAATMLFCEIFKVKPTDIPPYYVYTDEENRILQEAAEKALLNPPAIPEEYRVSSEGVG